MANKNKRKDGNNTTINQQKYKKQKQYSMETKNIKTYMEIIVT